MKLFLYYITDETVIDHLAKHDLMQDGLRFRNRGTPVLYGYTIDKEVAKKFEASRNMKAFHKVIKTGSREELESGKNYYLELRDASMYCGEKRHFILPLTGNEIWTVENMREMMIDYVQRFVILPRSCFVPEIRKVLSEMGYSTPEDETPWSITDVRANSWKNELGGILFLYKKLFNLDRVMEVGELDSEDSKTSLSYLSS